MKPIKLAAAALVGAAGIAAPVAATPASAATPGSFCYIHIETLEAETVVFGTVSADGNNCVPDTPLTGVLASLNAGAPCNRIFGLLEGAILVGVVCNE